MQSRLFVEVLTRKPEIDGDGAVGIRRRRSEGFGLGLPGDVALGVGGQLWRAQMIGLEHMDLPLGTADLGLPERCGTVGGVGLPAVVPQKRLLVVKRV